MSTLASRLVLTGSLFLFTLASGVWLSHTGKPYSTLFFTIHKLIALAAVISTAVTINHLHQTAEIKLAVEIGSIAITSLLFLFLIITGGLMSINKPVPGFIHTIHQAAPLLAVISSAATLYLLARVK